MAENNPDIPKVLSNTKQNLRTMKHGYEDLIEGDLERQNSGIRNIAVFGRATTRSLQRLKSRVTGFEQWYSLYREEMEKDPLMKHFWEMRNQFLKQGENPTGNYLQIHKFSPTDLHRFEKPDFATDFFMDTTGAGWIIELPDGSKERYYVDLPEDIGKVGLTFTDPPDEHLGKDISHTSLEEKCELYVEYIQNIVMDAEKKWGK